MASARPPDAPPHQPTPIRILLVDDHTMLRAGTRRILEDEDDLVVVGEAGDGAEALELAERLRPDLTLLDINMPQMDGVQACRLLRATVPTMRILILTGYDNIAYVRALYKLGVDGYLLKSVAGPRELAGAIRGAMNGQVAMSAEIATKLARRQDAASLSAKELDVLRAIAQGMKNREIAEAQNLSVNTVEFHMRNILLKLEAPTRAAAVQRARERGLLETTDNVGDGNF